MALLPIPNAAFAQNVRSHIDRHQDFAIVEQEGVLSIDEAGHQEPAQIADALAQASLARLQQRNVRELGPKERAGLRTLTDAARYVLKKTHTEAPEIDRKITAAKLGGRVHIVGANENYLQFMKVNHLAQRIQTLGHQPTEIGIQIKDHGFVRWADIEEQETADGRIFKDRGGTILFQTDKGLHLLDSYSYLHEGLCNYNSAGTDLHPYDVDPNPDGRYTMEVWTGGHAWVVLKDAQGRMYSIGKTLGKRDIFDPNQPGTYISPLGKRRGAIESPDPDTFLPTDHADFQKVEIVLTPEKYAEIFAYLQKEKVNNTDKKFSFLKENCVQFVETILHKVGFKEVDTRIHPLAYLAHNLWSPAAGDAISHFLRFDKWYKKLLCFLPPIYLLNVFFAVLIKVLSLWNYHSITSDTSILKTIFMPWVWEVNLHYHTRLREWMNEQPASQNAPA